MTEEPLNSGEPDPPAEPSNNLIGDRLQRVLEAQEREGEQVEPSSPVLPWAELEMPRRAVPPWLLPLVVGVLGGVILTVLIRPALSPPPTAPPPAAATTPSPAVTDPVVAMQLLLQASPKVAGSGSSPSPLPSILQEAQTSDPAMRARLLAKLSKGVEVGRYDPFRKVTPPKPQPLNLPTLPPGLAVPPPMPAMPATPLPRLEMIQLRLVGVMTGPQLMALVEGIREGRPFKVRVSKGQTLLEEFRVKELDMQRMKIQSKRYKLTLPLGQMKTLQRSVLSMPVMAPLLPPSVVVRERSG